MRILYFMPRYWPSVGGAQLLSRELIRRIGKRNVVQVVTQFTSDRDSFQKSVASARSGLYYDGELCVHRIGPSRLWGQGLRLLSDFYGRFRPINPLFALLLHLAIAPQLTAIVREFRPDIVHAFHIGLVYSSETAFWIARRVHVPYIWTPYPHIEGNSGWRGPRFRRLYGASDAIVAMTNREKEWLVEQGALAAHVHVIPVGPLIGEKHDGLAFRRAHNLADVPVVLFVGQKLAYKGYRQIVEAAPAVWAAVPEARFVFIGPRTPESEQFFASVNDQRIIELPAVEAEEKDSAFTACDVFCMPSLQESLGGVFLEAWSYRKPVVAARIDIAREVIDDGVDGLLVDQEPHSISQALIRLLTDDGMRAYMGEAGYEKVRHKFDWNTIVARTEQLYQDLSHTSQARSK